MTKKRILGILFLVGLTFVLQNLLAAEGVDKEEVATRFEEWLPNMGSDTLTLQEESQQGWQAICFEAGAPGNEEMKAEVNALMVDQLSKPIDPVAKTWLLYQLSRTGTDAEVDAIAALCDDPDPRVQRQAVRTLATIKTDKAIGALETTLSTASAGNRETIEETLKVISYDFTIPAETAWPLRLPYATDQEVDDWMAGYDQLSVTEKARTIAALTVRGDKKYRPVVLEAIQSGEPDLVRNGILALEKLGTVEDVPLLIEKTADPDWRHYAQAVAVRIEDPDFNDALLAQLGEATDPDTFETIATILVGRFDVNAFDPILAGVKRWDDRRVILLRIVEQIASKERIGVFIDQLPSISSAGDREEIEKIIMRFAGGDSTPVLERLTDANRVALLPVLGRIGDDQGVAELEKGLASRSPAVRNAAVKGLCNVPNAVHADDLYSIANDKRESGANRIAALRAYIRVISLPEDEIGISITDAEKLEALKNGMKIAVRDEEKSLVLDRAKSVRTVETLNFVLPFVDQEPFSNVAINTVMELAHHDFLRKENPDAFRAALDKVIEKSTDHDIIDEAKRYKDAIQ